MSLNCMLFSLLSVDYRLRDLFFLNLTELTLALIHPSSPSLRYSHTTTRKYLFNSSEKDLSTLVSSVV